jgi:nitrogen fixation NifU-like protein
MDLRELYQEIIMDHNRHPRNHRIMPHPTCEAKGYNPLCGDKLTVYLQIEEDKISDISFMGCGCAISQASASLMTDSLQGCSITEAHELFEKFHTLVTSEKDTQVPDKLSVLAGVRSFPARVKCATLAWHTLECALKQETAVATTE